MIRSKGEAGTGNIVEAVRHLRSSSATSAGSPAPTRPSATPGPRSCRRPSPSCRRSPRPGALPVPLFCAGASPRRRRRPRAQLGAEAVFVGSGIFKSADPERMARAIVEATTHFDDAELVAKVSTGLGAAMRGEEIGRRSTSGSPTRGW